MLTLQIFSAALLILITVQDLKTRSVSWPVFPLLGICGVVLQLQLPYPWTNTLQTFAFNMIFLVIQFLFIRVYFIVTRGRSTSMLDQMIGWGDLLFLICAACFLPLASFIVYYVGSLLVVLIGWLLYRYFSKSSEKQIPLAGLQSILLLLFLLGDWLFKQYDLFDEQLFTYLTGTHG